MYSHEILQKLETIPTPVIMGNLLFFDSWEEPEDFYTMSLKQRQSLKTQWSKAGKQPTRENVWVWFGPYSKEGKPRINNQSVVNYLYQVVIKPSNDSRLRPIMRIPKADVNPFKYHNSIRNSALSIAEHRKELLGISPEESLSPKNLSQFEKLVQAVVKDIKEYRYDGVSNEELKQMMLSLNHPPLAVDEAFTRL